MEQAGAPPVKGQRLKDRWQLSYWGAAIIEAAQLSNATSAFRGSECLVKASEGSRSSIPFLNVFRINRKPFVEGGSVRRGEVQGGGGDLVMAGSGTAGFGPVADGRRCLTQPSAPPIRGMPRPSHAGIAGNPFVAYRRLGKMLSSTQGIDH